MLEIKDSKIFELPDNIFLQKIAELEKYWAFNVDKGEHYSLNESSYWILEKIAENMSLESIFKDFLDNFDVDKNKGKKDFNEIIMSFIKEGILEKARSKHEKS